MRRRSLIAPSLACAVGTSARAQGVLSAPDLSRMEAGSLPPEFLTTWRTGHGALGHWRVVEDGSVRGGKAIEQSSADGTDYRFPLAVYQKPTAQNVAASVRFKATGASIKRRQTMRIAKLLTTAALVVLGPMAVHAADADWAPVATALGKFGAEMPGSVYRVGLPRTDLQVTLDGVQIKPTLALGSWLDTAMIDRTLGAKGKMVEGVYQFGIPRAETVRDGGMEVPVAMGSGEAINFQPTGGGKAAITGDFVLTAKEANPVLRALRENDIEVTAVHNHMLDAEPRLFFMHFGANENAAKLARGIRAALDKVNVLKS